ncbi:MULTISPECIES: hypothetical protein [unclassified Acinetobacter]|uniref:hypothetical protein n=1 Tax=unclassified Acinetobacter TaxID=196816 RepID=UPI0025BAE3A8|nr:MULTISPECIES: hypothetical protein [unclassified Acinetobacter]
MSRNIDKEIRETEQELKHVGSCTTKGLTADQIAQLDERFFLAIEKLAWLKGRRDVRVFEWKPINIFNLQENESSKQSHVSSHCRKRMKNI